MYPVSLSQVTEFHRKFGHPVSGAPNVKDHKVNKLRVELLREEVNELTEALENEDVVEVLDALTDIQYVLDGAYLALGLHPLKSAASFEVHRSNMSKLGADGKPIRREDGKTLKGPNYSPPNLKRILDAHLSRKERSI